MFSKIMKKSFNKFIFSSNMRYFSNDLTYSVSNVEFKELMDNFDPDNNVVFLDVREDEDISGVYLPAYNTSGVKLRNVRVPILDLVELQIGELEQYKDTHQILCYCRNGNKSVAATRILNLHGYNAINLKGGLRLLKQWTELWTQGKNFQYKVLINCITFKFQMTSWIFKNQIFD